MGVLLGSLYPLPTPGSGLHCRQDVRSGSGWSQLAVWSRLQTVALLHLILSRRFLEFANAAVPTKGLLGSPPRFETPGPGASRWEWCYRWRGRQALGAWGLGACWHLQAGSRHLRQCVLCPACVERRVWTAAEIGRPAQASDWVSSLRLWMWSRIVGGCWLPLSDPSEWSRLTWTTRLYAWPFLLSTPNRQSPALWANISVWPRSAAWKEKELAAPTW